jgi:hypothetical protein
MVGEALELFPFDEGLTGLRLHAGVAREGQLLKVEYRLGGEDSSDIVIPELSPEPARRDGLWEHTCLELFFAEAAHPWYWEANLSPSLDWQLYHFRAYREGRKLEGRTQVRGERLPANSAGHGFLLTLDTAGLFTERASIDVGVSAVIEGPEGKQSFWALAHAGPKPDFHQRKSFVLQPL